MADARKLRWGYIDITGRVAIDFRFDHASQFNEGMGLVRLGGKLGFIDKRGEIVIEPSFGDESQPFIGGLAMVQAATGKCGYIDHRGRYAIEPIYDWAQPFSEGIALVRVAGKYGYIARDGKYRVEPRYDHAESYIEGHASVAQREDWYILDTNGSIRFGPFGSVGSFSEGVANVWHQGSHALLWSDGTIVPVRGIDWLSEYFSDGLIEFLESGRCGYLNREGKVVISAAYDEASTFREGLAQVKMRDRWGYINTDGAMVIEPRFAEASFFKQGVAYVNLQGAACYIDRNGKVVLETGFKAGLPFSDGVTPVYVEEGPKPRFLKS
jgi:hypothetical protein